MITSKQFGFHQMRIAQVNGNVVFCERDIQLATEQKTTTQNRNQEIYRIEVESAQGAKSYEIFLQISDAVALANKGKRAQELTSWLIEQSKGTNVVSHQSLSDKIDATTKAIDWVSGILITNNVGVGLIDALKLSTFQKQTGIDVSQYQKLLPPVKTQTYEYEASDLGRMADVSGIVANLMLKEMGMHNKPFGTGPWELTELGKKYGAKAPFTKNGKSGIYNRWTHELAGLFMEHYEASRGE